MSDRAERRRRTNELSEKLHAALADGAFFLSGVCEDSADHLRAMHAAFAIAVLSIQSKLDHSRQVTIDSHMRNQFVAVKNAFKGLAENNQAIWHEPPRLGE